MLNNISNVFSFIFTFYVRQYNQIQQFYSTTCHGKCTNPHILQIIFSSKLISFYQYLREILFTLPQGSVGLLWMLHYNVCSYTYTICGTKVFPMISTALKLIFMKFVYMKGFTWHSNLKKDTILNSFLVCSFVRTVATPGILRKI